MNSTERYAGTADINEPLPEVRDLFAEMEGLLQRNQELLDKQERLLSPDEPEDAEQEAYLAWQVPAMAVGFWVLLAVAAIWGGA
jgi:hypothetical protein